MDLVGLRYDEGLNIAGGIDDEFARLGNTQQQWHRQPLPCPLHFDDDGRRVQFLLAPRQQTVTVVDDLAGGGVLDDDLATRQGIHLPVHPKEHPQAGHLGQPDDREGFNKRLGIPGLGYVPPDGRHQVGVARGSRLHDDETARPS